MDMTPSPWDVRVTSHTLWYVEGSHFLSFLIDREETSSQTLGTLELPPPDTWQVYAPEWAQHRRDEIISRVTGAALEHRLAVVTEGRIWTPDIPPPP